LGLSSDLLVHEIDLLDGDLFFADVGGLAWCGCFSSNIVEGVFTVGLEFGVLKLPGVGAVLRLSSILIILPNLVEVVFVQLPDEAGEVGVFEVFGQD
jgi:hypothetical protein